MIIKRFFAAVTAAAVSSSLLNVAFALDKPTATVTYDYGNGQFTREMEKLTRGLIAVASDDGVYLSWRLLGEESTVKDILTSPDFNVYRDGELIATVTDSTNYYDSEKGTSYSVAPVTDGVEGEKCAAVLCSDTSYFDIALDVPEAFNNIAYTVGDTSCGDLDGDGEYELVVKWDCNSQDNSISGVTGNVLLDAYKMDGTKLWRINLGRNIRAGAHYTQFLVYDFDKDGIAEITAKTAPGSIDGNGVYVSAASADSTIKSTDNSVVYVNDGGYVITGEEFFTIFDGESGAALDTIYYPTERVSASAWGDTYGNRCDRYIADVAYLDGENPYAVYWRGYYGGQTGMTGRTGIFAARFDGERLRVDYIFDTRSGQNGYTSGNEDYIGQGNHNMTVADVDGDGKDEFLSGALCFEADSSNNLAVKWCSYRGHGDALHIGNYDPTHNGLEYFSVHEGGGYTVGDKTIDYGMTVYDAATGEELFHEGGSSDTARGIMANVGAGGYYQIWSTRNNLYAANGDGVFTDMGSLISQMNFRIFWDADLNEELLDSTTISNWNGKSMESIFTAEGCIQTAANSTKATPALTADLFGDWREEVVYPTSDNSLLRIFTTTKVTKYKLPTLMHDPVYRSGVASEQSAYNQPPHIGYYISEEMFEEEIPEVGNLTEVEEDFEGNGFDGMYIKQAAAAQSKTVEDITYYVGGRANRDGSNGGDGFTGFSTVDRDNGRALSIGVGRFANNDSRRARIVIDDASSIRKSADYVVSFDVCIPSYENSGTYYEPKVELRDLSGNVVDTIVSSRVDSESVVENDKWYSYKLIYHDGVYYRAITDENSNLLEMKYIGVSVSGNEIASIFFSNGTSLPNSGGWGASVYMDNINIYVTRTAAVNGVIRVVNEAGKPVEGAVVTAAGINTQTKTDGSASYFMPCGTYALSVSADGYESVQTKLEAFTEGEVSEITVYKIKIKPEKLTLDKDVINLRAGDMVPLEVSVQPSNADIGACIWASDDSSVVRVSNGVIKAMSAGSTSISVSIDGLNDECTVNVYDCYESVPASIETDIVNTDIAVPMSGAFKVEAYAYVIDQHGVKINAEPQWSFDDENICYENGEIVCESGAKEGTVAVSIKYGELLKELTINITRSVSDEDIYVEEYGENAVDIKQGKENQSVQSGDITYNSGARGDGGDGYTGFGKGNTDGNNYIIMQAGRFHTSTRNAYMVFDNAPSEYSSEYDYVFETMLYIENQSNYQQIVLSNNGTHIKTVSATEEKYPKNVWFKYMLICDNGTYYEALCNAGGSIISVEEVSVDSTLPVNRLDMVLTTATPVSYVYLDDILYYRTASAFSDVTVAVSDEFGKGAYAEVTSGSLEYETDEYGYVNMRLPVGVHDVSISRNGVHTVSVICDGNRILYEYADEITNSVSLDGSVITVRTNCDTADIYGADYAADGTLKNITMFMVPKGETKFDAGKTFDKLFVWKEMQAITVQ